MSLRSKRIAFPIRSIKRATNSQLIGEHLFDLMFECRFFDRFEKRANSWKISEWTAVYDNDRISPVIPGSVPSSFFTGLSFEKADAATSGWRFFLEKTGRPIRPMIVGGSDEEMALRREVNPSSRTRPGFQNRRRV